MVKIGVQWGTKVYSDVNVLVDQPPMVLRSQLWSLTGVPADRQKIMIPGKGLLRDDMEDLSALGLKDGSKLLLVGTAEDKIHQTPVEQPIFYEDLTSQQKAKYCQEQKLKALPPGLRNLGNTCYLNSVIQFVKPIDEFCKFVKNLPDQSESIDPESALRASLRDLFRNMEETVEPATPSLALRNLRVAYPAFARKAANSVGYMQQDAEECLAFLLETFRKATGNNSTNTPVDKLFQFSIESRLKCIEDDTEAEEVTTEKTRVLPCHLGTQMNSISNLHSGIKHGFQGTVEKNSPNLGRLSQYVLKSSIASLPRNLIIHFVRFEWKNATGVGRSEATRAKIVRKVHFANRIDLYEFCTPPLKDSMKLAREIQRNRNETEAATRNKIKAGKETTADTKQSRKAEVPKSSGSSATKTQAGDEQTVEKSAGDVSVADSTTTRICEEGGNVADAESTPMDTGHFDLQAVITHQGRTADDGHYIAWIKHDENTWFKMDDDTVTAVEWKNVDLAGGRSDFHIAVLLLYKKFDLVPTPEEIKTAKAELAQQQVVVRQDEKKGQQIGGVSL